MRQNIFKYLGMLVVVVLFPFSATAQEKASDDPEGAMTFLEGVADETLTVWSDSTFTQAERDFAFKDLFKKASDLNLIGKMMLGRHYRTANTQQRKDYLDAVGTFITTELDRNMSQLGFEKLNIIGTTPAAGKKGHIYVRTEINREEGEPIKADWRIRKKNKAFQIVNLEVEGINLIITNREIFSARIKDIGLDAFIEELRTKSTD